MRFQTFRRVAIAATLAATLAACGTTPTPVSDTRPAPAERVTAFATQPATGDYGTLIVTRDRGLSGSAAGIDLIVNGTKAATLRQGERVTLYVPAGEDLIVTAQVLRQTKTIETTFKPGQTRTYRMSFDPVNNLNFGAANLATN
jgi:hypothetical protein